jgi:acetolactate synthase-1/2/3 large subunit
MRLSDYVMKTLADKGVDTAFLVTGGMAMFLDDALAGEPRIKSVCCHHEQGASYAAEGYGHVSGRPALVCVTAGPGAINSMSGVFGAFVDSVPMIVLAGQAKRELLRSTYNFVPNPRQLGEQEVDSVAMTAPITKYANRITDRSRVRFELEKAFYIATTGRPGPVWLEIPTDVQSAEVEPELLVPFRPPVAPPPNLSGIAADVVSRWGKAERPLLVVGPGVGELDAARDFERAASLLGCPVVGAGPQDALTTDHPQYAGRMGALGTRAGNMTVQNADLILFVGLRCYVSLVTYNWPAMGRNAHKIMVEDDPLELEKPCQIGDEFVLAGPKEFLSGLAAAAAGYDSSRQAGWLESCLKLVRIFPPVSESMRTVRPDGRINPYWFVEELCGRLTKDDVIAASNASASIIPIQAGASLQGQRFFSNLGCGAMGFGLPAAVGAALAEKNRRVVAFEGDGGLMMNLQELETLARHRLNVVVVILENDGYVSIRQTQRGFFGRELGCGPESGVSLPDFAKIAAAFGLPCVEVAGEDFKKKLDLVAASEGPLVVVARLDPEQPFVPKVASRRLEDGTMVSSPPEDMAPFLPRDQLLPHLHNPLEDE